MKYVETSDINQYVRLVNAAIQNGYSVIYIETYWKFVGWRYIRIYYAVLKQNLPSLKMNFGPVIECPLPVLTGEEK